MWRKLACLIAGYMTLGGVLFGQLDRAGPPTSANSLARDTARVSAGADRFRQLCTGCHGRDGEGGQGEGRGPNLATNWEVRRVKDQELFSFIKNGVKGTAMPAFSLPDEQIWQLAAFVRSLNAPAINLPVQGDVSSGKAIFFGKGECSSCHMVRGQGGYLGPDLSDIGATRRLSELRAVLVSPSLKASSDFRPLLIEDAQGRKLRAVAKHSTPWSVQALDEFGALHFVRGTDIQKLALQDKSWMAADFASRLSAAELTDLIAYLSRQAVRPPSAEGVTFPKGAVN